VYGLFSWANLGTLSATYTIDGGVTVAGSYPVTTSSLEYINGVMAISNFLFVTFDSLSAGNHTLVIKLTQCDNHAFALDYITYTPSFANLVSMPGFVPSAPTSSTPGIVSTPVSSKAGASPTTSQTSHSKRTPVGSIVGGVGGVLVALALIAFLLFWLRRRKLKKNSLPELEMDGAFLVYCSFKYNDTFKKNFFRRIDSMALIFTLASSNFFWNFKTFFFFFSKGH
jgi:hypothetical protein